VPKLYSETPDELLNIHIIKEKKKIAMIRKVELNRIKDNA
jgi:hypothetical protein